MNRRQVRSTQRCSANTNWISWPEAFPSLKFRTNHARRRSNILRKPPRQRRCGNLRSTAHRPDFLHRHWRPYAERERNPLHRPTKALLESRVVQRRFISRIDRHAGRVHLVVRLADALAVSLGHHLGQPNRRVGVRRLVVATSELATRAAAIGWRSLRNAIPRAESIRTNGREWVVGGVEAKCFAYGFALLSARDMIDRRWGMVCVLPALHVFHPIVGGWARGSA